MFNKNYLKGKFVPKNPKKCLNYNGKIKNAKDIVFRSSYEKIFCNFLDLDENVIEWGSEIVEIPYYSKTDNRKHKYITDFVFVSKNSNNIIEKWLVEIKPKTQVPILNEKKQIVYPDLPKMKRLTQKRIDRWKLHCDILTKNHEKWESAKAWCKNNNYKFKVITEDELALS